MALNEKTLNPLNGKYLNEYIRRLQALLRFGKFGEQFESEYVYSKNFLDKVAEYYFDLSTQKYRLKKPKAPKIERQKINGSDAHIKMKASDDFLLITKQIIGLIKEKYGDIIVCDSINADVFSTFLEIMISDELARSVCESGIKTQMIAYQVNREMDALERIVNRDDKAELTSDQHYDKMIINSVALAPLLASSLGRSVDRERQIKRILTGKESVEQLLESYNISFDNECVVMHLAHRSDHLKINGYFRK